VIRSSASQCVAVAPVAGLRDVAGGALPRAIVCAMAERSAGASYLRCGRTARATRVSISIAGREKGGSKSKCCKHRALSSTTRDSGGVREKSQGLIRHHVRDPLRYQVAWIRDPPRYQVDRLAHGPCAICHRADLAIGPRTRRSIHDNRAAYNIHGDPFEVPATATTWRVRIGGCSGREPWSYVPIAALDATAAPVMPAAPAPARCTVYDAAGCNTIPHRRLGRRMLFSRHALALWLAGTCQGSSESKLR
jgi:hypothetical protein